MGVDRTDYLMFGVQLPADLEPDALEAEIDGAPGRRFDAVFDGMCGKYFLAGKIIATSDPYEGFELATIDPKNLAIDRTDLAEKISAACGKPVSRDDFRLLLFSHFH